MYIRDACSIIDEIVYLLYLERSFFYTPHTPPTHFHSWNENHIKRFMTVRVRVSFIEWHKNSLYIYLVFTACSNKI